MSELDRLHIGSRRCNNNNNENNNNGFKVRFGVRRLHLGPPFAQGHHQYIILVMIQDDGVA